MTFMFFVNEDRFRAEIDDVVGIAKNLLHLVLAHADVNRFALNSVGNLWRRGDLVDDLFDLVCLGAGQIVDVDIDFRAIARGVPPAALGLLCGQQFEKDNALGRLDLQLGDVYSFTGLELARIVSVREASENTFLLFGVAVGDVGVDDGVFCVGYIAVNAGNANHQNGSRFGDPVVIEIRERRPTFVIW